MPGTKRKRSGASAEGLRPEQPKKEFVLVRHGLSKVVANYRTLFPGTTFGTWPQPSIVWVWIVWVLSNCPLKTTSEMSAPEKALRRQCPSEFCGLRHFRYGND